MRLRSEITGRLDRQMQIWFQEFRLHYNSIGSELAGALTLISQGFSRHHVIRLNTGLEELETKITALQNLSQFGGVRIKANPPETFDSKKQKVNEWRTAAMTWIIASGFTGDQATVAILSLLRGPA